MDKREDISKEAWEIVTSMSSADEKNPVLKRVQMFAAQVAERALSQARSKAYEECAKIAEDEDGYFTHFGEDRNTRLAKQVAHHAASAIRQHSQNGGGK